MSTFVPRAPYTEEELEHLYPKGLQLQQVQVLLRHGERTPVSARFENAGLAPYWPYCLAASHFSSVVTTARGAPSWDRLQWQRRLETLGTDDAPTLASGPSGEIDGICKPGELTDRGRETTFALGQRLRHLYVEQLGFMPRQIASSDGIYLRSTPVPRALESLQQAFTGFYPPGTRSPDSPPPSITVRMPADETLYPNEGNCKRFSQLARAFAQRAADRWNDSDDMEYLNKLLGKWMPASSPRIAVDSHPRLSGIMDTANATKAHGQATKLPKEFYDDRALAMIDKIAVDEWFAGYAESKEYRTLGIGPLMGDVVGRMVENVRGGGSQIKLALSGCHDTTLAATLQSLGTFEHEKWPPFTGHIAFELFGKSEGPETPPKTAAGPAGVADNKRPLRWWQTLFGSPTDLLAGNLPKTSQKPLGDFGDKDKQQLDGYYVRVRYNDRVMQVPACRSPGNHLEGDESLCTLVAFKSVVDKFTPTHWRSACSANIDQPAIPLRPEPAGL